MAMNINLHFRLGVPFFACTWSHLRHLLNYFRGKENGHEYDFGMSR
jgi:hypothetical protein